MQDVTRIPAAGMDCNGGTPRERALRRRHMEGFKAALGAVTGRPPVSPGDALALARAGAPGPWPEMIAVLDDLQRAEEGSSLDLLPFPAPAGGAPGISAWDFTIAPLPGGGR